MYKIRALPPFHPWEQIPRPEFPKFIPPAIGPRCPLPTRPSLFPYKLKKKTIRAIGAEHRSKYTLLGYSNPLFAYGPPKVNLLDRIHLYRPKKYRSSRVLPWQPPPPRMGSQFWRCGFRLPRPHAYAIGVRQPLRLLFPLGSEMQFRWIFPEFRLFLDKWSRNNIDYDDPKNLQLIRDELKTIFIAQRARREWQEKQVSSIKRPYVFEAMGRLKQLMVGNSAAVQQEAKTTNAVTQVLQGSNASRPNPASAFADKQRRTNVTRASTTGGARSR